MNRASRGETDSQGTSSIGGCLLVYFSIFRCPQDVFVEFSHPGEHVGQYQKVEEVFSKQRFMCWIALEKKGNYKNFEGSRWVVNDFSIPSPYKILHVGRPGVAFHQTIRYIVQDT